jgi:hypothetical protein
METVSLEPGFIVCPAGGLHVSVSVLEGKTGLFDWLTTTTHVGQFPGPTAAGWKVQLWTAVTVVVIVTGAPTA